MKKTCLNSLLLIITVFIIHNSFAQPQYFNYDSGGLSNAFPFNVAMGKRVQHSFAAGEFILPTPAPAGNITSFFIRFYTTAGPSTFSNLTFKLGQTLLQGLPPGQWYTGQLDTVYFRSSVTLSSTKEQFLEFTLDRPFAYDNTQALILEISQCGLTGNTGMSVVTETISGIFRTTSLVNTSCPFSYGNQGAFILHSGISVAPLAVNKNQTVIPDEYILHQNYPNPFNPTTNIEFSLPQRTYVSLTVFDVTGRVIRSLISQNMNAGDYSIDFYADELAGGIYFYTLQTESFIKTKKMILIK